MPHVDVPITGYSDFDQEHRDLVRALESMGGLCAQPAGRRLVCACCDGEVKAACRDRLLRTLDELRSHAAEHFRYEEALMDRLADWGAVQTHVDGHKRAHVEIAEDFEHFLAELDLDNPGIATQRLKETMQTMIGRHVQEYDATFARLLAYTGHQELRLDPEVLDLLREIGQKHREE